MTPTGVYYALPTTIRITQQKARHRKIETTLRYDHVSDEMVREYFAQLMSKENHLEKTIIQENEMGYF